MRKYISIVLLSIVLILTIYLLCQPKGKQMNVSLKPDHLDMLVSLDGEEDEYYEQLTLFCNGKKVDSKKAKWYSEDPEIAIIEEDGWVTSMGVGSTEIVVKYKGHTARCYVNVTQKITSDTRGE